ncbi:MAG: DUF1385 domain-containing protein [Oscillospiraceae bacterium]|nr:DUF1385 domain-containing protein [Oscillospiraceae bacterium]MBQ2998161.1 DUF1385 domain-containing protein [Oscillospiraceae bacterium]MBQ3237257.1 DUF1385 domain-containing protein [Oscillospiraceae bacterium]MBQ3560904.1 DUF1385 domain-containing protein [Oscillospiraceae bacterium]MBQ6700396.1 DUF1385 domain-containing protein [Oscillospiraceae bacterium]
MERNEKQSCAIKTSVGGQALLEGIMMKGPFKSAMAVRKPNGEIDLSVWDTKKLTGIRKVPFVRGIFNFVDTLIQGYDCLMKSAEISGQEEEPDKFELWLDKTFGKAAGSVFSTIVTVLALVLAIGLFFGVPALVTGLVSDFITSKVALSAIEGVIKIGLFLVYVIGVSQMKDIKRTFMYHGAEHKTIFCYEQGLDLTVENVRMQKRFHPRCGTSFLLIVLVVSVLVSSVITWENLLIRVLLKVLMLPITVGISYEIIKFAGRHDNWFTKIISAPGLWLQNFTTQEPDDSMIEIAIAAVTPVLPENPEDAAF